jgi:hypothetical protein
MTSGRFPRILHYNPLVNENDYSDVNIICYFRIKIVTAYMSSTTDFKLKMVIEIRFVLNYYYSIKCN